MRSLLPSFSLRKDLGPAGCYENGETRWKTQMTKEIYCELVDTVFSTDRELWWRFDAGEVPCEA